MSWGYTRYAFFFPARDFVLVIYDKDPALTFSAKDEGSLGGFGGGLWLWGWGWGGDVLFGGVLLGVVGGGCFFFPHVP